MVVVGGVESFHSTVAHAHPVPTPATAAAGAPTTRPQERLQQGHKTGPAVVACSSGMQKHEQWRQSSLAQHQDLNGLKMPRSESLVAGEGKE